MFWCVGLDSEAVLLGEESERPGRFLYPPLFQIQSSQFCRVSKDPRWSLGRENWRRKVRDSLGDRGWHGYGRANLARLKKKSRFGTRKRPRERGGRVEGEPAGCGT